MPEPTRSAVRERALRYFVIGIICSVIVSASILVVTHAQTSAEGGIFDNGSNETKNDHKLEFVSVSPNRMIDMLNATPFRATEEWSFNSYDIRYDHPNGLSYDLVENGTLFDITNNELTFSNRANVPLGFIDELTVTIKGQILSGACNIEVEPIFQEGFYDRANSEISTSLQESGIFEIAAQAPVTEAKSAIDEWACMIAFYVTIRVETAVQLVIESVTVSAHATQPLVPVTLNVLGSDSQSVFENPWGRYLNVFPAVNMTLNTTGNSAVILPRRVDDIVYVPTGLCFCDSGWCSSVIYPLSTHHRFNITLSETNSSRVTVILPTTTLYLDITPQTALDCLIYQSRISEMIYAVSGCTTNQLPESVYLPITITEFSVELSVSTTAGPYRFEGYAYIDANRTWVLSVHFPIYAFLGLGLSLELYFLLVFIISLIFVTIAQIQRAARPFDWASFRGNKENLPLLILLLSYLLPWYVAHQSVFRGGILVHKNTFMFAGLNLVAHTNSCEFMTLRMSPISLPLLAIMILLWLPIIYGTYSKVIHRFSKQVFTLLLLAPLVISVVPMLWSRALIPLGSLGTISAVFVWFKHLLATRSAASS